MTTIKGVAELAKVSQSTVSRVLTGHARVANETKERVLKAIKDLDYSPNLSAQSLASKRSNSIGMLVGTASGPYFPSIMRAVEETARNNGFHLIPTSGDATRSEELDAVNFLKSKQVDGLIIHVGKLADHDLLEIVNETPATIILNHYIPEIAENCINLDEEMGGYLATKYLLENGHTKIACITGPMIQNDCRGRLQGYCRALKEFAIKYDANLVVEGRFDLEKNLEAPRKLLDRDLQVTAIFCLNDQIALGVYDVLKDRHLSVGDDLSVIGYDNSFFCSHVTPKLTTINFPTREMSEEATQKVISLVKKKKYLMPQKLLPKLIIRNSVKKINEF